MKKIKYIKNFSFQHNAGDLSEISSYSINDQIDNINTDINETVSSIIKNNNNNYILFLNNTPLQESMVLSGIKMIASLLKRILKYIRNIWDNIRSKFLIFSKDCSKFMRIYDSSIKHARKERKIADYNLTHEMINIKNIKNAYFNKMIENKSAEDLLDLVSKDLIHRTNLNPGDLNNFANKDTYINGIAEIEENRKKFEESFKNEVSDSSVVLSSEMIKDLEDYIRGFNVEKSSIKQTMNVVYNSINSSRNAVEQALSKYNEENKENQNREEVNRVREGLNLYIDYVQKAISFLNIIVSRKSSLEEKILKQSMSALRKHLSSYTNTD